MSRRQRTPRTPRTASAAAAPRQRMGRWALLGALLGLLLVLALYAPARWLAHALERASQGQVQLQQARGTLWNGSAVLVLTGGAGSHDRMRLPGRLHWALRPAWLGAWLQLLPDCCAAQPAQLRLRLGWQRAELHIATHQSQWPSSLLQGLGAPWNTLQLDGQLGLHIEDLRLQWAAGRSLVQGQLQATLKNATSRLSTIRPLGSYRLIMHGGQTLGLQLHTDAGPLQLSGQGHWQGQRLRFAGQASATPEHLPALSNLLSLLGRRDGDRAILNF